MPQVAALKRTACDLTPQWGGHPQTVTSGQHNSNPSVAHSRLVAICVISLMTLWVAL